VGKKTAKTEKVREVDGKVSPTVVGGGSYKGKTCRSKWIRGRRAHYSWEKIIKKG